jgi:hypothetical protein
VSPHVSFHIRFEVNRIGSGRFNQQQQQQQQQRAQEHGQRRREGIHIDSNCASRLSCVLERMRRCGNQSNGHLDGTSEFHLDIPPMPIWQNSSLQPSHVQLLPTNIDGHHSTAEHLINDANEQMDRK